MSTTLLPATDALSLACAAVAELESAGTAVVSPADQATELFWYGRRASTFHSDSFGDIDIPDHWQVSGFVQVFAIGQVR